MRTIFTFYTDKQKKWRWRAKRAGRIVATSGENYSSKAKCRTSMLRLIDSIHGTNYRVVNAWRDSENPR